jgi:hypothetical protein
MITIAWTLTFWLFVVGWFCCCGSSPLCNKCSADADAVSVTFAGFVDGDCDCTYLNATFVLARVPLLHLEYPCAWIWEGTQTCVHGDVSYTIQAYARDAGAYYYWLVGLEITVEAYALYSVQYLWEYSATPQDCTTTKTLTYDQHSEDHPVCTGHATSTCQVN